MQMSDEQAAGILTVGSGRGLRARPADPALDRAPSTPGPGESEDAAGRACWRSSRRTSREQVFTHASLERASPGTPTRGAAPSSATAGPGFGRDAYLLSAPGGGALRCGTADEGFVLKPSRASPAGTWLCALELPERLRAAAPEAIREGAAALDRSRAGAGIVVEAVIGACYLHAGYERTAEASRGGVRAEIEGALEAHGLRVGAAGAPGAQQARRSLRGHRRAGFAHERIYSVSALVEGRVLGTGSGRSKKHAEQEAARIAVDRLAGES